MQRAERVNTGRTDTEPSLVGGVEAGGTKFVCAVGTGPHDMRAETRFPTTSPNETIDRAVEFFREHTGRAPVVAIGIATFGPIDLDPCSPTFGFITVTPKAGWRHTEMAGSFRRALGLPVSFDTDVNAAALAEHRWGAGEGLETFVYLTVGTGVGGGAIVNGRLLHGLGHPEMGHIRVPHDREVDPYRGACPYHGDCLEGLASSRALAERWGRRPEMLPADHPAWSLEARYLALGLVGIIGILSPQRIVIGGGVMNQARLFPLIRENVVELLGGYVQPRTILDTIEGYIVAPALGSRAGVLGAIALAQAALMTGPIDDVRP
jgi:fructokinase